MPWSECPPLRYETHYGDRVVLCFADRPAGVDQILREAVAVRPDSDAIIDGDRRFTFRAFDQAVDEIAAGLTACGVEPGDRVALLLSNCAEFAFVFFGAMRAGAVAVPLNTREQKPELEFTLGNCGAKVIVHDAELEDRLPDAASVPTLKHKFAVGSAAEDSQPLSALFKSGEAPSVIAAQESPAVILYTSGTTERRGADSDVHGHVGHALRDMLGSNRRRPRADGRACNARYRTRRNYVGNGPGERGNDYSWCIQSGCVS